MCGIFALYSNYHSEHNLKKLFNCMKLLQHRGKDGYGIVFLNNSSFIPLKEKGMILYKNPPLKISKSCLGHLRYSTSGVSLIHEEVSLSELQPLKGDDYYLAHNGNIPNIKGHDTTFLNLQILNQLKSVSMEQKLINLIKKIPGSYSLVLLTNDALYGVRDRFGIRPLAIGKDETNFYISSETCAFKDINYIRDVNPGEIIKIDKTGLKSIFTHPNAQNSLCSFEILYFMNKNSFFNRISISHIRKNLGSILAKKETFIKPNSNYIVIGIPETGICSGKGYAESLHLQYNQLITKKQNKHRTFIILDKDERKRACDEKFNYNQNLSLQNVILIDDTIVRGNIIKSILKNLKKLNVNEIHIRIPAPPVIDICELGISIQSKKELLMNNKTIEDVKMELGVNSIEFLSIQDLEHFPKLSYNQCFTGYINPALSNQSFI